MAWRVIFKGQAKKFLGALPDSMKKKVKDKILKLLNALENAIPPYTVNGLDFKKLRGYQDLFRIRIGKIRIIVEIDTEAKTVIVLRAGERGQVYKRMG